MQLANGVIDSPLGLCIGAGPEQIWAIKEAQIQGLRVLALDGNPQAPGLQLADIGLTIDISNSLEVVQCAKYYSVDFTLPVPIGNLLTTQAAVHEALGLKGVQRGCAHVCSDKLLFHNRMLEIGVSVPTQTYLSSQYALESYPCNSVQFPLVIKPRCGSGSRGVRVVNSLQEWSQAIAASRMLPSSQGWLIQSFVDGDPLGVDGAVVGGEIQIVLIREKELSSLPYRVELSYRSPAQLPKSATRAISLILQSALGAIGANNCLFHADIILRPDQKPVLIEISARPSGLLIASKMVPACTGVNFLARAIDLHRFGQAKMVPNRLQPTLLRYWNSPGAVVKKVPDISKLLRLPYVVCADVGWDVGQLLQDPTNVSELLSAGYILISAPRWRDIETTLSKALSFFRLDQK